MIGLDRRRVGEEESGRRGEGVAQGEVSRNG